MYEAQTLLIVVYLIKRNYIPGLAGWKVWAFIADSVVPLAE